jgi:hypothetical protein
MNELLNQVGGPFAAYIREATWCTTTADNTNGFSSNRFGGTRPLVCISPSRCGSLIDVGARITRVTCMLDWDVQPIAVDELSTQMPANVVRLTTSPTAAMREAASGVGDCYRHLPQTVLETHARHYPTLLGGGQNCFSPTPL